MKTAIKLLFVTIVAFVSSCSDFDRYYDQINDEFPRSLSMYLVNPDIAAGDTAVLRTVWGGQEITPQQVHWEVSWKLYQDAFGSVTVLDRQSLEPFIVSELHEVARTEHSQTFEMSFVVPDDIILNSPNIPEEWTTLLEPYGLDIDWEEVGVPAEKTELLAMLDSLATLPPEVLALFPKETGYQLNGLCQFATVNFRLFCDYTDAGGFEGKIDFPVRYHSKLEAIPGMYKNEPPIHTGWKIYEVNGDPVKFDPRIDSATREFEIVDGNVEITYDRNNTYFLAIDFDKRDSVITTTEAFGDQNPSAEQYYGYWYYDENAFISLAMTQQADQDFQYAWHPQLVYKLAFGEAPVRNTAMQYWFEMQDYRSGIGYRPAGKTFTELNITIQ